MGAIAGVIAGLMSGVVAGLIEGVSARAVLRNIELRLCRRTKLLSLEKLSSMVKPH